MTKFTLADPIEIDGQEITEFELRKPCVRDLKAVRQKKDNIEGNCLMLSFICTPPISPEQVELMSVADYSGIFDVVEDLMGKSQAG